MNQILSNKVGGGKKECRGCIKTVMKNKSGKKYVKKCRKRTIRKKKCRNKKKCKTQKGNRKNKCIKKCATKKCKIKKCRKMGECEKRSKKKKLRKDVNVVLDTPIFGKCTSPPEDVNLGDECRSFDRCVDSECVGADIADPCVKGKCKIIEGSKEPKEPNEEDNNRRNVGGCTSPPQDIEPGDDCRSFDRCIDSKCVGADSSDPCVKGKCEIVDKISNKKKNS